MSYYVSQSQSARHVISNIWTYSYIVEFSLTVQYSLLYWKTLKNSSYISDLSYKRPNSSSLSWINEIRPNWYRIRTHINWLIFYSTVSNVSSERAYMVQKAPAFMLLAKKVPDALAEVPLRPISIEFQGEETLDLHEECLMPGWHFFYKGVWIYFLYVI